MDIVEIWIVIANGQISSIFDIPPHIHFSFLDNLSTNQWIFIKLDIYIYIVEIWFGIACGLTTQLLQCSVISHFLFGYWNCYMKMILLTKYSFLEFQGSLWNTSRYPNFDIRFAELRIKLIRLTTSNKYMCNWTLEVRDRLKILWKRGEIAHLEQFLLFSTICFTCCWFSCLGRDQIFTSR